MFMGKDKSGLSRAKKNINTLNTENKFEQLIQSKFDSCKEKLQQILKYPCIKWKTTNQHQETGFTTSFSPLEENVVQRDYTRPNVKIEDVTPIEEPTFSMPSFEELDSNFRQQLGEEDPSGSADPRQVWGAEEPAGSANPYTENLDKKEQKMASQAMVDAILDGYAGLKNYSNRFVKIPTARLEKMIRNGEVDPNIMIPLGITKVFL
jgi:hypothetical protein